jgi:hypothetical protein
MPRNVWSHADLQTLGQHLGSEDWLEAVTECFPGRSIAAITTRMSKLRADLGIKGKRGAREEDQDRMNAKSVTASQQLLEATLRVGRWS